MKRILVSFSLFVFASLAQAAPFIVSDPWTDLNAQPDTCTLTETGQPNVNLTLLTNGSSQKYIHHDAASYSAGTHNTNVYCTNIWGTSATVPFNFTVAVPTAPANLRISN